MRTFRIRVAVGLLFLRAAVCAGVQREVPVLDGGWWKIGENSPDVTPYNHPSNLQNAADFTIFQATNGNWELVACIRGTTYYPGERVFHRWENTGSLTNTFWTPKGIFSQPQSNAPVSQNYTLQAPHCFTNNGEYHMFYNSGYWITDGVRQGNAAFCYGSRDGVTFTNRTTTYPSPGTNAYRFFPMGRDVNLFSSSNGTWLAYYAGKIGTNDMMVARSAPALEGPWSTNQYQVREIGNPESPFAVKRSGGYYLFQQMKAIYSEDPLNFDKPYTTKLTTGLTEGKYAPEVFEYQGQWYISGYAQGIWLAKMKWVTKEVSDADLIVLSISGLTPAFDSTQQIYTCSSATASPAMELAPADSFATIVMRNGGWAVSNSQMTVSGTGYKTNAPLGYGANVIQIDVSTTNGVQKSYYIKATRTGGTSANYFLDAFTTSGGSVDVPMYSAQAVGSTATVTAVAERYYHFSSWTGSVTSSQNPLRLAMNSNQTVYAVFAADVLTNSTPSWWLAQHGLETNDTVANADSDGDGLKNWEEWVAGTVPTQYASRLVLSNLASQTTNRVFTWSAVSGRLYSVYWSSNLLNGFGSNLAVDINGGGFTDKQHSAEPSGFYRIRVRIP